MRAPVKGPRVEGGFSLVSAAMLAQDPSPRPKWADEPARKLASQGLLITFSGMDGSGKTTAAERLVASLRTRGVRAVYFYGHRPSYHKEKTQLSFSILFKSMWRRSGRTPEEFARHPRVKTVYDLATFLDYLIIQWRLFVRRRPNTIVIVDRYVPDILAYLRFLGPTRSSIESLFVATAFDPDVALFFDVSPTQAFIRKQEQTPEELQRFADVYTTLRKEIPLVTVDAGGTIDDVQAQLERVMRERVGLAMSGRASEDAVAGLRRPTD